jgi:hypothetical protein
MCAFGSLGIVSGQSYTWTWTYDAIDSNSLDPASVHIGANYGPHEGFIVSEPEPLRRPPSPLAWSCSGLGIAGAPFLCRRK